MNSAVSTGSARSTKPHFKTTPLEPGECRSGLHSKLSCLSKPCHQAPSPNPFSNDGECPEELYVLNWSQVRSLPASAVAQSVEQLKRFSTSLSPSPLQSETDTPVCSASKNRQECLFHLTPHPTSTTLGECRSGLHLVTSEFKSRPAAMRRSLFTLVAISFPKQITSNGDECRWNYMLTEPQVGGSNPSGPTFPLSSGP